MPNEITNLISLMMATAKAIKTKVERDGLSLTTMGRLKTLRYIDCKNHPTMKAIADEFGITPPSVTELIAPMVLHGLVKKVYDKKDHRMVRLALTIKGKNHLDEHRKNMTEKIKELMSSLDKNQIKNLKEILQILLKNSKN